MQYITGNVTNCSSAALTEKHIMDTMALCFADVGEEFMPNLIVCGQWGKRKINSFYAPYARMERTEKTGGVVIDNIESDFGRLGIMLNYNCPAADMWLLNSKLISMGPLNDRAFFDEELAKSGDYIKGQIVGEYTFAIKCADSHGRVYGFSTTT